MRTNTEIKLIELLRQARNFMVDSCRECSREGSQLRILIDDTFKKYDDEMAEYRKNLARDSKDLDRTLAAWKRGER
jgi:hypothetical protein